MTARLSTARHELEGKNTELATALQHLQESRQRLELLEQLKGELSKFVPEAVKRLLEQNPNATELEKKTVEVSVLFLDIAGYTKLSEQLEPRKLNQLVQTYFSELPRDHPAPPRRRERDGRRRAHGHLPVRAPPRPTTRSTPPGPPSPSASAPISSTRSTAASSRPSSCTWASTPARRWWAPPRSGPGPASAGRSPPPVHHQPGGALRRLRPGRRDHRGARPPPSASRRSSCWRAWASAVQERLAADPRLPRHPAGGLREDRLSRAGRVRVGICSWADPALIEAGSFYPRKSMTAEARLRFYAGVFDVVEVNASYYAIPDVRTTRRWAERTPPGFVFHVKACAPPDRPPPAPAGAARRGAGRCCRAAPADAARRDRLADDFPPRGLDAAFRAVPGVAGAARRGRQAGLRALPVRAVGALRAAPAGLPGLAARAAAGLRGRRRVPPPLVVSRSRRRDAGRAAGGAASPTSIVDAPAVAGAMPHVTAVTAPTAVLRLHGRNAEGWLRQLRGEEPSVREKYDYLYSEAELRALVPEIGGLVRGQRGGLRLLQQQQPRLPGPERAHAEAAARPAHRRPPKFLPPGLFNCDSDQDGQRRAADPPGRARLRAHAPPEARAPLGRAGRRAVGQARRPHGPAGDRQQDPQAGVPGRRGARPARRHADHVRHAAVQLLPRRLRRGRAARPHGRCSPSRASRPPSTTATCCSTGCSAPRCATAPTTSGSKVDQVMQEMAGQARRGGPHALRHPRERRHRRGRARLPHLRPGDRPADPPRRPRLRHDRDHRVQRRQPGRPADGQAARRPHGPRSSASRSRGRPSASATTWRDVIDQARRRWSLAGAGAATRSSCSTATRAPAAPRCARRSSRWCCAWPAAEGIMLDPVYTAKAFARAPRRTQARARAASGRRICFIHTGGIFSIFPFRQELSRLADRGQRVW